MQYVFGDHVLDSQRRELRRGGELVRLERKPFDVLLHLVRRRDHVVGAPELLARFLARRAGAGGGRRALRRRRTGGPR